MAKVQKGTIPKVWRYIRRYRLHQQTVCKLIHVCDDPAEDAAGGGGIQIAQRKDLQLAEGFLPHIPDYVIGDPVVEHIHDPLGQSGAPGDDTNFDEQ